MGHAAARALSSRLREELSGSSIACISHVGAPRHRNVK
jgi:hypothetical protein